MRQGPLPQARAASTYSRAQMDRAEARVMRLRGYGNGIVLPLATMFIECAMEAINE